MGEIKCSAGAGEKLYTHAQQHTFGGEIRLYTMCGNGVLLYKKGKEGGKSNFRARSNGFCGVRSYVRKDGVVCLNANKLKLKIVTISTPRPLQHLTYSGSSIARI